MPAAMNAACLTNQYCSAAFRLWGLTSIKWEPLGLGWLGRSCRYVASRFCLFGGLFGDYLSSRVIRTPAR